MYVCMYYWPVQWFTGLLSAKKKKKEADWDDKNFWCSTKSGVSTLWIIKPISRSVIWLYNFHVHQNSCLVLFLLRKRLFCVLVTFLDILFLSLFSKVLFGGESWTQETVACWISVTSALQPTYDHHIFNTGEDEDCFLNSRNEVKILDSFLHLLFSLFSFQAIVPDIRNIQVLVIFFLISAYEVGPGPISWFIAAELFDQSARPIAMAFTSMLNWGGKFLLALLFPLLLVCVSLITSTRFILNIYMV